MFRLLGHAVRRAWFLFLAGWAVLLLGVWHFAPPWNDVAQDREFAFLPQDASSRRAEEVFQKAFPDDRLSSTVVLVVRDVDKQRERDGKFIEDVLEPGLRQIAEAEGGLASAPAATEEPLFPTDDKPAPKPGKRSIIARIRTPNAPGAGALLVSPDEQIQLVVAELTTEFLSTQNWSTIARIEELVRKIGRDGKLPPGVEIFVTGSAVIGRDHALAQLRSARATETLTVVLVIILLLVIYRAPLLALIPLATVYLAVQVSLKLLANLAGAGYVTLFQGIQIYITILAYGAGVDYCLFLIARYREVLDSGAATPGAAIAEAIKDVGAALSASAATVIFGIGMMVFARFGKFREAGVAIPISIFLVLCATLTFSAALLRLAGPWAFWPLRPGGKRGSSVAGASNRFSAARWLQQGWDRIGQALLRRPGTIWLGTVALMTPGVILAAIFHDRLSYDLIGNLPADAPSVAGTRVLREHVPAGTLAPVTLLLVDPHVDFSSERGRDLVGQLTDRLHADRQTLGLADIRSLTAPLGVTEAAQHAVSQIHVSEEVRREAMTRAALDRYVTDLGERAKIGTRLDLILDQDPFARQSIADLDRIEQKLQHDLPAGLQQDTQLYFVGPTASVRDLEHVMRQDRTRIEALVLASVLVVLVVLLRRLVVSLYLLASVLFSYYTTLGVSFALFWLLDPSGFSGIDWKVAIFLFTILIAVGEDYNIFLMSRVDAEVRRHGPVRGVVLALERTGPIISSCGIIMAGTFAALLAGSLTEMKQLGFALSFGILLDTFVVRPILVPAFLISVRKGWALPLQRLPLAFAKPVSR